MRKYGLDNFKFEIIEDGIVSIDVLSDKEREYIKKFKSHVSQNGYNISLGGIKNQYDSNPKAKLTVEDVVEIRCLYESGEISVSKCWEEYKDRISYSAFEKILEGRTWKGIKTDVYTDNNKKKQHLFKKREGSKNGNALYTEEEVMNARMYYVSHSLTDTFKMFGSKSKSKAAFRNIIDKCYNNLPKYSKIDKRWIYKGEEIDINDFNPVSTISVSGE